MRVESVQIETARRTLGELVDRARIGGEPTLILRGQKPGAVLVPVTWYERASEALGSAPDGPKTAPAGGDQA